MGHRATTTRGFTLIELLVSIGIIALLISIGVVGLSRALRQATEASDRASVRALRIAIETFEQDHGFLPPLVYDGDPLPVSGPSDLIPANGYQPSPDGLPIYLDSNLGPANPPQPFVGVYLRGADLDFFRGGEDADGNPVIAADNLSNGLSDARYSKFSLPIYLAGVMPPEVDGRGGLQMSPPDRDGSFQGVGPRGSAKTIQAYVPVGENESFQTRVLYGKGDLAQSELRELAEHDGDLGSGERPFAIGMFMFGFLILWVLLVIMGTFLRGPNWNFYGPFEFWDPHKVEALVNVNLSEYFWLYMLGGSMPSNILIRELPGFVLIFAYLVMLPPLLAATVFSTMFRRMGFLRYMVFVNLLLLMMALPIKMVLRWAFNLKYIVGIPEFFFNI